MKKYSKVSLIGAASGWGAQNKLTEEGPIFLKKHYRLIKQNFFDNSITWRRTLNPKKTFRESTSSDLSFEEIEDLILNFSINLSEEVISCLNDKNFPLILGGDHSIAIGTWSGVVQANNCHEKLGLIWIDAHMDAHTPNTSLSQAIHGMPLALLMNYGSQKIRSVLFNNKTIINPEYVTLIGIRSFEEEEKQLLKMLGVKVYYIEEVFAKGFENVFNNALDYLTNLTSFIGLSIDIDAFDPKFAPGTGCREKNGLLPHDFIMTLDKINLLNTFTALEIVEYNPSLDKDFLTFNLIKDIINLCNKPPI
ncbi:MAG: arginase [Alphaproteobacteria bacterium]|jgi:arginase|nr:arginase [Alphaproteobacteria bacterium]